MAKVAAKVASKSGTKTGLTPNNMQILIKNNEMFVHNFKKFLHGVNKKVYAHGIALTLHRVVRETVHDTGRAAANWNISFGSVPTDTRLNPSYYGQEVHGGGKVGYRHGHRTPLKYINQQQQHRSLMTPYKAFHYGYDIGSDHDSVSLKPNGRIYSAVDPLGKGAPKAAYIYNPIITGNYYRYANNAFYFFTAYKEDTFINIKSDLSGIVGPVIYETAQQLRFPITYKK